MKTDPWGILASAKWITILVVLVGAACLLAVGALALFGLITQATM